MNSAERLSSLIAEIEAEAYARGQADARREFLDAIGTPGGQLAGAKAGRGSRGKQAAPKRKPGGRKRAPRGSVPGFVERALQGGQALAPPEILERAATHMERLIKLASVRTELRNGRRTGKYELKDGRWSLAAGSAAEETGDPAPAEPSPGSETGEAAGSGAPTG
ncbi:MAG: hypothetical protein OXC28_24570 [Defluviicoccus sp.]|nr:hypothetical protein [Defluviicoccus sp.]